MVLLHRFQMDGRRLVLDVASGALHVVDETAWFLLDRMEEGLAVADAVREARAAGFPGAGAREAAAEIEDLAGRGQLWSPDPAGPDYMPPVRPLRALCLHLAHDCNLRCAYCFAGQGRYRGSRSLMSFEVGKQAIDYLLAASGSYNQVEIDFFGGEPLLNFAVLRRLVRYGRERETVTGKRINFTVTTNGVLLDETTGAFLDGERLGVVLSLDGRPEVHDAVRRTAAGAGSYALAAPRVSRFAVGRDNWNCYARGTYTRYNTDFCRDFEHLAGLGFAAVSLEPVVAGPAEPYALGEGDYPALAREYERLARLLAGGAYPGVRFFHFDLRLDDGPCLSRRVSGCGAGTEYLAVDPAGDLYPCHQFVGRAAFRMGNVAAGVARPELAERFRASHALAKAACARCWARYFCSGGCHANNLAATGDMREPGALYCLLVRKRIECGLFLRAQTASRRVAAG